MTPYTTFDNNSEINEDGLALNSAFPTTTPANE